MEVMHDRVLLKKIEPEKKTAGSFSDANVLLRRLISFSFVLSVD